jgi:hypothetical protein
MRLPRWVQLARMTYRGEVGGVMEEGLATFLSALMAFGVMVGVSPPP